MNGEYLTVSAHIRRGLAELKIIVERTESIWQQSLRSSDDYYVDAAALNLHSYYAGAERIFEMIATRIDRSLPDSAHWHKELLEQMTLEIPGVRPAILDLQLWKRLDDYRGFRHVVRNIYTYNLDGDRIAFLVKNLPETAAQMEQALSAFADLLEQLGAA
ncbi:MAG: hypothetical protein J5I90_19220 [Caldilineales bacterium]|nr:hypothetical protein [Caldilineales bacterium]